jgi:LPS sulfotransferase NodH
MSIALSLLESRYDFPNITEHPTCEIMIAAIPRSGSTMFCLDLWESGVLGAPLEYLNFRLMKSSERWHGLIATPVGYWNYLQKVRTSPNGVFSYKMFPSVYQQIAQVSEELLSRVAPTHVIYLTRNDIDAQAVSYSKAIQGMAWFADVAQQKAAVYSYNHIVECKNILRRQMDDWEYIFDLTGTSVLRVAYEDILKNKESVVATVVRHITGSTDVRTLPIPRLEVQRDNLSRQWTQLFAEESQDMRKSRGRLNDEKLRRYINTSLVRGALQTCKY